MGDGKKRISSVIYDQIGYLSHGENQSDGS